MFDDYMLKIVDFDRLKYHSNISTEHETCTCNLLIVFSQRNQIKTKTEEKNNNQHKKAQAIARYEYKFNVANEQNALVQGFTWYTMEIIIAARIYCLDVRKSIHISP